MQKLARRFSPLLAKFSGKAPLCPWGAAFSFLNPKTFRVHPPKMSIEVVETRDDIALLRFGGKHSFWFPASMPVNQELWSEYLVAFWDSPTNFHQYLVPGISIGPTDTVLDCGTCEGFFTRAAIERGAARVISVEPSKIMAKCLRLTFAPEISEGKVVIRECALGDHPGTANFSDTDIFGGHIDSGKGSPVEVTTIDQISSALGPITFVKMDLEGVEYQALVGGSALLAETQPKLAITTYHNPWDYAVIAAFVSSMGYRRYSGKGVTMRGTDVPRPIMLYAGS
jgi:FkbM family methyltransferase